MATRSPKNRRHPGGTPTFRRLVEEHRQPGRYHAPADITSVWHNLREAEQEYIASIYPQIAQKINPHKYATDWLIFT